jgi:hypothetical protein
MPCSSSDEWGFFVKQKANVKAQLFFSNVVELNS